HTAVLRRPMIIYGDHAHPRLTSELLAELGAHATRVEARGGDAEDRRALLLVSGCLAQGLLDDEFGRSGGDTASRDARAALDLATCAAQLFLSLGDRQLAAFERALSNLRASRLPATVRVKVCEGFAHYAVYPEQYARAASALR